MKSNKSLESLFSFEDDVLEPVTSPIDGPSFSADEIQEAADVAADQTALETSMEALSLLAKHGVSFEGVGANIKDFFKKIWDGVKKFFAWIGGLFKKLWDWITGKNKKLTEAEIVEVEKAQLALPAPITVAAVKEEAKVFVETRKEIIQEATIILAAMPELKKEILLLAAPPAAAKEETTDATAFAEVAADEKLTQVAAFVDAPSPKKVEAISQKIKSLWKKVDEVTGKWADAADAKKAKAAEASSQTLSNKDINNFIDKSILMESYALSTLAQNAAAEAKKISDKLGQEVNSLMQAAQTILDKSDDAGKSDLSESDRTKFVHLIGKINSIIQKIEKKVIDPYAIIALPCYKVLDQAKKYVAKSVGSTGGDAFRAENKANAGKSFG